MIRRPVGRGVDARGVRVRALAQQVLDDGGVAPLRRHVHRRPVRRVEPGVDGVAARHQLLAAVRAPAEGRGVQLRGVQVLGALVLAHVLFQLADLVAARREDVRQRDALAAAFQARLERRLHGVDAWPSVLDGPGLRMQRCGQRQDYTAHDCRYFGSLRGQESKAARCESQESMLQVETDGLALQAQPKVGRPGTI